MHGGDLWVAGGFDDAGGVPVPGVARWTSGVASTVENPVTATYLGPGHPTPFNPTTPFLYRTTDGGPVRVAVYDARGQLVSTLALGSQPPGQRLITWNGCDEGGRPVASGVYVVRLDSGRDSRTRKITLAK